MTHLPPPHPFGRPWVADVYTPWYRSPNSSCNPLNQSPQEYGSPYMARCNSIGLFDSLQLLCSAALVVKFFRNYLLGNITSTNRNSFIYFFSAILSSARIQSRTFLNARMVIDPSTTGLNRRLHTHTHACGFITVLMHKTMVGVTIDNGVGIQMNIWAQIWASSRRSDYLSSREKWRLEV